MINKSVKKNSTNISIFCFQSPINMWGEISLINRGRNKTVSISKYMYALDALVCFLFCFSFCFVTFFVGFLLFLLLVVFLFVYWGFF